MPQTKAHIKATTKWETKAYDKVSLRLKKGERGTIADHAANLGESLNSYIIKATFQRMERENAGG